jgi:porin
MFSAMPLPASSPRGACTRRLPAVVPGLLNGGLLSCLVLAPALGVQTASAPSDDSDFANSTSQGPFGFLNAIERTNYLLGDMWGLRTGLSHYGVSLGLEETSEVLGNLSGGSRRGADYDGLTQLVLQADTQRALGWYGGTFNVSALQLHGRNLSSDDLQSLQTASGIESDRSTRLWELWYQQKMLEEDRLDIKIGQQSLDQEFMVSSNALDFVNTMFGWPMLPSADLPGGGPAYPLSALGVRLRARPIDPLTILLGVFNGSPTRNANGDPQKNDAHGTSFPLDGGVLGIAEIQFAYPALGSMVMADQEDPLSCTYRLGVWYDTEDFADQRYDTTGLSLADPNSNGTPASHKGDYAFYFVGDQMIYRFAEDSDRNINLFVRAMGTPLSDRNLITFSMNAGLLFHEPFKHRDDDTCGIGMGYCRVSKAASGLDQDTQSFGGSPYPIRSSETFLEATYQYELAPWCQLQPDIQYIIHPGGGIPDPNSSTGQTIRNELVVGVRTNILF